MSSSSSSSPESKDNSNTTNTLDLAKLKAGLIVGVQHDGTYLFEPVGTEVGLIELFGLIDYASWRLNTLRESTNKRDELAHIAKLCETTIGMVRVIVQSLANNKEQTTDTVSLPPKTPE